MNPKPTIEATHNHCGDFTPYNHNLSLSFVSLTFGGVISESFTLAVVQTHT